MPGENQGGGSNIVIKVKCSRKKDAFSENVTSLAQSIFEQIGDRGYTHGMKERTLLYGIDFDGKTSTRCARRCSCDGVGCRNVPVDAAQAALRNSGTEKLVEPDCRHSSSLFPRD